MMNKNIFSLSKHKCTLHIFGVAVMSTFFYIKLYPLFFAIFSISIFLCVKKISIFNPVVAVLAVFFFYLVFVFLFVGKIDDDAWAAIFKAFICIVFFSSVLLGGEALSNYFGEMRLLEVIEIYLRIIVVMSFLQYLVLHLIYKPGFVIESSAGSNEMFGSGFIFWGVADKNMFGAKVALYGFLHTVVYYILNKRIVGWWFLLVAASCLMSMSRTALLLYFVSVFLLYYWVVNRRIALLLIGLFCVFTAYFAEDLFRVSSIVELKLNDGASYRLIYWMTFFDNFYSLPLEGSGILSARYFLSAYAYAYNGEPNLHNLYFNNYLDLGVMGSLLYLFLLCFFFNDGRRKVGFPWMIVLICPAIIIGNSLYTAYDNDLWVYYSVVFMIYLALNNRVPRTTRDFQCG